MATKMTRQRKQTVYTLVVGLGKTGLSVVRYLHALGEQVVVVDSRDIPPGLAALKECFPDVEVVTGGFDIALFTAAHRIIVSPGVPMTTAALQTAVENGIEISGDIDLFAHEVDAPVVGITGSNGKSTVTLLLTRMAQAAGYAAQAGGNIGVPVLDLLERDDTPPAAKRCYVLELSSFQLETLQQLPMHSAVVLNISDDHMDRYEDMAAYAVSKQKIYEQAKVQVVNLDDARAMPPGPGERRIGFTLGEPQDGQLGVRIIDDKAWLCHGRQPLLAVDALRLQGRHNVQNALAALALGLTLDLPVDVMTGVLRDFTGLPHRMQWVAAIQGVQWINDSKATNTGAAMAALEGVEARLVLIAGGDGKGADFEPFAEVVRRCCRGVVLLGQDAARIEDAILRSAAQAVDAPGIKRVNDMAAAVRAAGQMARPGDVVLLSPACASLDMFDSFEHRGEVFMQAVRRYENEVASCR